MDLPARRNAERDILRAICQGNPDESLRAEAARILAGYTFADPAHQIIFATLCEMNTDDARLIREQLPARLNNKGFPDVDLDTFFRPHTFTPVEILALMHSLRNEAPGP